MMSTTSIADLAARRRLGPRGRLVVNSREVECRLETPLPGLSTSTIPGCRRRMLSDPTALGEALRPIDVCRRSEMTRRDRFSLEQASNLALDGKGMSSTCHAPWRVAAEGIHTRNPGSFFWRKASLKQPTTPGDRRAEGQRSPSTFRNRRRCAFPERPAGLPRDSAESTRDAWPEDALAVWFLQLRRKGTPRRPDGPSAAGGPHGSSMTTPL